MKDRIKKIRKSLDLTQQAFAERIGVKRNTIGQYEIGRNEPIDAVVSLICREFNVNEEWLREGTGEMFRPKPSETLERLAVENNFSKMDYAIVEKIVSLSPHDRDELFGKMFDFLREIDAMLSDENSSSPAAIEEKAPAPAVIEEGKTVAQLEEEYKKTILKPASGTAHTASSTTGGGRKEA